MGNSPCAFPSRNEPLDPRPRRHAAGRRPAEILHAVPAVGVRTVVPAADALDVRLHAETRHNTALPQPSADAETKVDLRRRMREILAQLAVDAAEEAVIPADGAREEADVHPGHWTTFQ